MTRVTATPKQVYTILALREAGYTTLAISQRLNLSVRTIHRHLAAHGAKKGVLKADLIEHARSELRNFVSSDEAIRNEAAKLISDDLALSNHIRAIILEASEHLKASNVVEAALVMRAAAAYSTTLKNTSDTIRHGIGVRKVTQENDELPEVIIRELTEEELAELNAQNSNSSDLSD